MSEPVIICAALTGAATFKQNNPSVPYTLEEFADEAEKCPGRSGHCARPRPDR